jgi:hypothetical protein
METYLSFLNNPGYAIAVAFGVAKAAKAFGSGESPELLASFATTLISGPLPR